MITGVFCLPSLHVCTLPQNESLHGHTDFSCSVRTFFQTLWIHNLLSNNFHQHNRTTPYLVSGRDKAQPNVGLIHSLTVPGALVALSRPLSLLSCHFTRKPNQFTARIDVPDSHLKSFFSSEDSFLSASKVCVSGSPRPPARQMLGSLSLQAVWWIHSVCTIFFFLQLLSHFCTQIPTSRPSQTYFKSE